jgi:hypothetical protein
MAMIEFIFLFVRVGLRAGSKFTFFDILLLRVDVGMIVWDISRWVFLDIRKIAEKIVNSEKSFQAGIAEPACVSANLAAERIALRRPLRSLMACLALPYT